MNREPNTRTIINRNKYVFGDASARAWLDSICALKHNCCEYHCKADVLTEP